MTILLVFIIIFSLFYGTVKVPILEIFKIILNKLGLTNFEIIKKSFIPIILYVRLPRIMVSVLVGGALAVSGCTMQSILKNPIADSSIIGISSGASLGAVIAIATGLSTQYLFALPFLSIFCALLVSSLVYKISVMRAKTDNLLLILSGIAMSSFISAISSLILTILVDSQIREYIFWSIGSLSGRRWEHFYLGVAPILILSIIIFFYGKELNILLLGDEEAKSLGINVSLVRKKILVMVAVLTGMSVCISGNIGFVGLIVPHILRKLIGPDNKKLLRASFLAGAFFLTLSDLLARLVLSPVEISVGIITALIGAPYFIYLIIRIRRGGIL
ncbi:FecCD family ABC transporter permease [Fusobacterium russii]|uniref:FecCD family ABC transporter permease n=1 Tax=Fusobacterium russii TaxID=854 RepID=UPI000684C858|nr:iron ABC transporter permease [Fusobacterium russii]